jgi:hypothetical protein
VTPQWHPHYGEAQIGWGRNCRHGYPVLTEENAERKTFLLWLAQYCGLQMEKILGVLGIEAPVYM